MPLEKRCVAGVSKAHKPLWQYRDFVSTLTGGEPRKFQLISIDGPFGGGSFSRVDALELIPQHLAESFAIIMDDCERAGEQATLELLLARLRAHGVKFVSGAYFGSKCVTVICSPDLRFLCSL